MKTGLRMSPLATIKRTTKRCMLTDKFILQQTSEELAGRLRADFEISPTQRGDRTPLLNEDRKASLQFEESIDKTVRWYLENEVWMDNRKWRFSKVQ